MNLDNEEYAALCALARAGASTPEQKTRLELFLRDIEKRNGVQRYFLLVRWQEANQALPATTRFPEVWPPQLEEPIEIVGRPVAKSDVLALLASRASSPISIMLTSDPAGLVGWTRFEKMFP